MDNILPFKHGDTLGQGSCGCGRPSTHGGCCWFRHGKAEPPAYLNGAKPRQRRPSVSMKGKSEIERKAHRAKLEKERRDKLLAEQGKIVKHHNTSPPVTRIPKNETVWSDAENRTDIDAWMATHAVTHCGTPIIEIKEKTPWGERKEDQYRRMAKEREWNQFRLKEYNRRQQNQT